MDTLNNKIRSSRDDNYTEAQVVGITGYNANLDRMKVAHVTDDNELKVSITGSGGGDATAANQTLQLAQETIIAGDTTSLDSKITNGSDDTLTQAQQVLVYGRKDASPSGLRALKCVDDGTLHSYDTGLNMKITKGSDATLASAQQVLCYGRDALGNVDALKVDNQGHLEVVQDPEQQTNLIFSGSQAIAPSGSFAFTASADKNGAENMNIFVSGSSSLIDIEVYTLLSFDDVSYYEPADSMIGALLPDADKVVLKVENNPARYVRVRIVNNGVASVTIENITIAFVKGL
jgi:hypothetical protein